MAAAAPSFSYAQAAKGRSPSLGAEAATKSENTGSVADLTLTAKTQAAPDSSTRSTDSVKAPNMGGPDMPISDAVKSSKIVSASKPAASMQVSQDEAASTETVAQGSTATSASGTLPAGSKELAGTATPHDSEPSWDKVSQTSQNDDKRSAKDDAWDAEDAKISPWEDESASAGLKEAPPPAVNVWQKRAAEAKAKDTRTSSGAPSSTAAPSQSKKAGEAGPDTVKATAKPNSDDKVGLGISRGSANPVDGKARVDDVSRATEVAKPTAAPVPPPSDASSWPTPKLAEETEKRKTHDHGERADKEKTPNKPHGKEKWEKVPFVPTAVFNTPMPPRPGRGGRGGTTRGGREGGRGGYSGASGERSVSGNGENGSGTGAPYSVRGRGDMGPPPLPRGGATGGRGPKRSASAGPPMSRETRKDGDAAPERRDDGTQRHFSSTPRYFSSENRRTSTSTQTDAAWGPRQGSPTRRHPPGGTDREPGQAGGFHDQSHSRGNPERRKDASSAAQEFPREQGFVPNRERGDSRTDRGGRGGRAPRGGHPGSANQYHSNGPNGVTHHPPQAYPPTKSQSYTESRQGAFSGAPHGQHRDSTRHNRSGSRSQSFTNQSPFQRFSGNAPGAPQHPGNLQTDLANMYAYQHPNQPMVMSAVHFNPYMEHLQMQGMLLMQMEYYFSVENLCKDMFLRKHMDSQGFVFLTVIANFNRIKQLTRDVEFLRFTAAGSQVMELVVGPDGQDRVRKRADWQPWVLRMEERLPQAQNEGPAELHPPHFRSQGPDYMQPPATMNSAPPLSPPDSLLHGGQRRPEPVQVNGNGSPQHPVADSTLTQTPLSAAVPDFTPAAIAPPSNLQPANPISSLEDVFSDEQVENLVIVVRKSNNGSGSPRVTMPEGNRLGQSPKAKPLETSPTGSAHRAGSDRTSPVIVNGDRSSEPPFSLGGSPRPHHHYHHHPASSTPMYWVKDRDAPTENLPQELTHEAYNVFRQRALAERAATAATLGAPCSHDMDILYQFWSHFLVRNFNARMHAEFRALALEDARPPRSSPVGRHNLIAFYHDVVLGPRVVPDGIARDFVDLVRAEKAGAAAAAGGAVGGAASSQPQPQPAFDKLRAAWRNGAFNLKNRVKVDRLVGPKLKAELER